MARAGHMQLIGYPWTWTGLEQCALDTLQAKGSTKSKPSIPRRWCKLNDDQLELALHAANEVAPSDPLHKQTGCAIRALSRIAISTGMPMPLAGEVVELSAAAFADATSQDATALAPTTRLAYFRAVARFARHMIGLSPAENAADKRQKSARAKDIRSVEQRAPASRPTIPRALFSKLATHPEEELVLRAFVAATFDGVVQPAGLLKHPCGSKQQGDPIELGELTTAWKGGDSYEACISVRLRDDPKSLQIVFSSTLRTRRYHPRPVGAAKLLHELRLARIKAGAADRDPLWVDSSGELLTLDKLPAAMVRVGAPAEATPDSVFRAVHANTAASSSSPPKRFPRFGRWRKAAAKTRPDVVRTEVCEEARDAAPAFSGAGGPVPA